MNTVIKYTTFDKYLPLLLAALATASTVFGVCWSLHASIMLYG